MRFLGLEISRTKAAQPVSESRGGWRRMISEPFTGAWQRNQEIKIGDLTCYPTLYACLNRISQDIGKLPFVLKSKAEGQTIWSTVENPAYSPVLRKPNDYQTAQQFREAWILSKLIHGNAYILKQRDNRGVVVKLYVLDPCRVVPMISDAGLVFYQINYTSKQNLLPGEYGDTQVTVPASEVIHDRLNTFHHQLIGVPPLCAAYWPAVKNMRILRSAAEFFGNGARPGGILKAPAGLDEGDAKKLQDHWNTNYTGENSGRIAIIGADLTFEQMGESSADSQLVEQMRYSDEQICQPFGIPPFKIGIGSIPSGLGVDAINLLYKDDALSGHIEAMENLLDEGLSIPNTLGIWMDTEPLLRMDVGKQAEVVTKLIGGKAITPDEGRHRLGYGPTGGGDTLWGQHQDYPLGYLAERKDLNAQPEPQPSEPEEAPNGKVDQEQIERGLRAITALNTIKAIEAVRSEVFR